MQSLNGGLSHEQSSRVSSYNINWSLEGANKSVSVSAQATKSTYSFNIDDILFDSIAEIQLTLDDPLIYAGSYQDVIRTNTQGVVCTESIVQEYVDIWHDLDSLYPVISHPPPFGQPR